jgi:hypothetical protein
MPYEIRVAGDCHLYHVLAERKLEGFVFFQAPAGAYLLAEAMNVLAGRADLTVSVGEVRGDGETDSVASVRGLIELKELAGERGSETRWRLSKIRQWNDPQRVSTLPLPYNGARFDLLLVYDGATGASEGLTASLMKALCKAVVIQCRHPKNNKSLLFHLVRNRREAPDLESTPDLVVVVDANDIRDASAAPTATISSLSHERAAMQLADHLADEKRLGQTFATVDFLMVALGPAAIAICRRIDNGRRSVMGAETHVEKQSSWQVALAYESQDLYHARQSLEDRIAFTAILAASVAEALAAGTSDVAAALGRAAYAAMNRARIYRTLGLKQATPPASSPKTWCNELFASPQTTSANDMPVVGSAGWSLLRSRCPRREDAITIARRIVQNGLASAREEYSFPIAQFGKWTGVDLEEIEGYQNLRRLMLKYVHAIGWDRPLSLAAFGPPGSGKSFGIRQVADSLRIRGREVHISREPLEFNLGGFTSLNDLARALHHSRDIALKGEVPLVMFDEFDSTFEGRPHGWLKYLLAPTQDGRFYDAGSIYHVGRGIFVFVGAVNPTFEDLAGQMRSRAFVEAKGPDFVSRLRGHVNVRGPDKINDTDEFFVIRRAILLDNLLERQREGNLMPRVKIDPGIAEAFLRVSRYRHGVRSIEALIEMSDFSEPPNQFAKSSLPPMDQLEMHTDAFEFLRIVSER